LVFLGIIEKDKTVVKNPKENLEKKE